MRKGWRGEKELSSESGDWKREGDTRATQPPSSLQRSYINLGEIPKRKEGRKGKGDGGKKLKSGMEAKAIALRKASEGNNIAWRGSDPSDIDSTLNFQKVCYMIK